MPHYILEYSDNIGEPVDPGEIFPPLHQLLINEGFDEAKIKSRIIRHDQYYIGNGNVENAFVHLTLAILNRHELAKQKRIGQQISSYLKTYFSGSADELNLAIRVEIRELEKETYFVKT